MAGRSMLDAVSMQRLQNIFCAVLPLDRVLAQALQVVRPPIMLQCCPMLIRWQMYCHCLPRPLWNCNAVMLARLLKYWLPCSKVLSNAAVQTIRYRPSYSQSAASVPYFELSMPISRLRVLMQFRMGSHASLVK